MIVVVHVCEKRAQCLSGFDGIAFFDGDCFQTGINGDVFAVFEDDDVVILVVDLIDIGHGSVEHRSCHCAGIGFDFDSGIVGGDIFEHRMLVFAKRLHNAETSRDGVWQFAFVAFEAACQLDFIFIGVAGFSALFFFFLIPQPIPDPLSDIPVP